MTVSVQTDHGEELLASRVEPAELDVWREWFCYTKPLGPSIKIIATPASGEPIGFCVVTTGNQPGYVENVGKLPTQDHHSQEPRETGYRTSENSSAGSLTSRLLSF